MKDRAFFFGSYEGYRLNAGKNFVEAVPSEAAWNRAVPAVAGLRPGFTAPGAIILPGASANADFDIAQLQATQDVTENSYGGRLDFKMNDKLVGVRPRLPRSGREHRPAGRHRPILSHHAQADERHLQPAGAPGDEHDQRVQAWLQRRSEHGIRTDPGRFREHLHQPQWIGGEQWHRRSDGKLGHRQPRWPGPRQQRGERPRGAVQPVFGDVRRLRDSCSGQPPPEVRRRRTDDPHDDRSVGARARRRRDLRRPRADRRSDSADRSGAHQHDTVEWAASRLSDRPCGHSRELHANPNNRAYQPRAPSGSGSRE